MLYYIIGILVALLIMTVIFLPKRSAKKRELRRLSDDDYISGIRNLARENRIIERGKGVTLEPLLRHLNRAERIVLSKINKDKPVTEGEKWFYENLYYVKRFFNGLNTRAIGLLPHSAGGVRILNIARFIVENSMQTLDFDRIKKGIHIVNNETVLTYQEITFLRGAIGIALTEQIYILARRITHYNKMQKRAERAIIKKGLKSDIYLHFLLNSKSRKDILDELTKRGINPEGVEFNYSMSVVETTRMAKYLFEGIKTLNDIFKDEDGIALLLIDKKLSECLSYSEMSFETKKLYLSKIAAIGDMINVSELLVTNRLLSFSAYNNVDPVIILFEHTVSLIRHIRNPKYLKPIKQKTGRGKERNYIFGVIITALVLAAAVFFIFGNPYVPFLALAPALLLAELIINNILSRAVKPRPLPEMNYTIIPSEHSAMIVVSEFITSKEQMKKAIEHLKEIGEVNKDKNITAALLVDLKPSDSETDAKDAEITDEARALEGVDGYCVFIRKRTKINKRYGAYERKRGAINALVDMLVTGDGSAFSYISDVDVSKPEYIIALDSDNVLSVNGARELINIIAHPANGRYDLIALRSRYNLYSLKTPYAKRFLNESAFVTYPNYSSFYYNMFGRDIFCGKGIFRVKSFHRKLNGVFPDNKVLSHDIIEGAILETASGSVVYEDAPKNFVADRERRKRWARGDIQLLPFVAASWKKRDGGRYESKIRPIYKFLIIRNVVSLLSPIFLTAIAVFGLFYPSVLYLPLVFLSAPFLFDALEKLKSGFAGKIRIRYILKDIISSFLNTLLDVGLLPYYALCNLRLFAATLYRMAAGGNLLEWKTYYHSQTSGGKFADETALSMLILPLIIIPAYFFALNYIPFLIFAAYSYLAYLSAFLSGFSRKRKKPKSERLYEYARKTYAYFKYMRKKGALIADNLQVRPYKGMSATTSPTNIGFHILSEISAYLLRIAERAEILEALEDIIYLVERLDKWEGHLYNWYGISDGKPALPFVSSVDSGNFIAALIILREFLKEENESSLAKRADAIIKNTKLSALYDGGKRLFHLGYNVKTKNFEGHYDLFASESRLLSFVFAALCGNSAHWKALVRDFTPAMGNTLLSWSGTMFEYLMPDIFVKSADGSLSAKSSENAVRMQIRKKARGVFGLSESGYYLFDDGLRYQYKAFGMDKLALGREKQKNIVSPYSTFLALEYKPKACLENLEKLEAMGVISDYGFYEAVDMEGQTRILNSYMTHHQGMIMSSLTNYLTDGKLRNYLLKDDAVRGACVLLTEHTEKGVYSYKNYTKREKFVENEKGYYKTYDDIGHKAASFGLTDGALSAYFSASGDGFTLWNGTYINRFTKGEGNGAARMFYVSDNGRVYSPSYAAKKDDYNKYTFSFTPVSITYANVEDGVKLDVAADGNLCAEINKLSVSGGYENKRIYFYEPLSLASYAAQNAHPVFNNLFCETEYLEKYNAIIAKKRLRKGEKPIFAALVIRGLNNIIPESNRFNVLGRGGSESEPAFLNSYQNSEPSFGDVLEPCFAFSGDLSGESCEVVKLFSDSYDELIQKIVKIPEDYYGFAIEAGNVTPLDCLTNSLLYPLISGVYPNRLLSDIDRFGARDSFIEYTGGKKLITFGLKDESGFPALRRLAKAISELRYFEIFPSFSVITDKNMLKDAEISIIKLMDSYKIRDYRIIRADEAPPGYLSAAFISFDKNLTPSEKMCHQKMPMCQKNNNFVPIDTEYEFKSGNGGITDGGYLLPLGKLTGLPYANVVALGNGGFMATENGGGMFFYENAYEDRVTRFDNDPVKDTPYEIIAVNDGGKNYRINGGKNPAAAVLISQGFNRYFGSYGNVYASTEVYTVRKGGVKVNEITVKGGENLFLTYAVECVLGTETGCPFIYSEAVSENVFKVKNLLTYKEVFIKVFGEVGEIEYKGLNAVTQLNIELKGERVYIALGKYRDIAQLSLRDITVGKNESIRYFRELNNVKITSPDKALNELFNNWLLYQTVSSRMNGKLGFYQIGGATGFRDQLQDSLALLESNPERVRKQILIHAERQYKEGDVMHWWHHPRMGLRTKISDDKLFLPYAAAEYIRSTGDKSILNEKISYLESKPLSDGELSRYENPPLSTEQYTLSHHCLAAIRSSLKTGEHNLLLLGTGDWNDGMDFIGEDGKGESVVLTMFAYETINKFIPYVSDAVKEELSEVAEKLKKAVKYSAYDGRQFMRLYGDDGKWYGSFRSDRLSIDLISQSFSVLSGITDAERAASALKEAERLVDKKNGIIRLLEPPLDENTYIGYISAYPRGVRENGGQYTHGAVWYIMALIRMNEVEKAYELFKMINPLSRCADTEMNKKYKGEPYVMSADIYSSQNAGRMGWSWYTGSAAWTYRLILNEFFGIRRIGNRLYVDPKLPKALSGSTVLYNSEYGTIKIEFMKNGKYSLKQDGLPLHERRYADMSGVKSLVCYC